MGAACCAAAKDRTIVNGPQRDVLQRHVPYSPSWSLRWDNRGRVAGEEIPANWLHNGGGNDRVEVKSSTTVETSFSSEEASQLDGLQSLPWQKSPVTGGNENVLRLLAASDQTVSQCRLEVNESAASPSVSQPSHTKSTSPVSSKSQLLPSRWHLYSPRHQVLSQVSPSRAAPHKSPTFSISEEPSLFLPPTSWSNESTRGSNGGSSDSWSIPVFSDPAATRRERWSFDSENSGFSLDRVTRLSLRNSRSSSIDLQTCGVCAKLLTERSPWLWCSQKIISNNNELAVVAVLTCGHVYHAECLEYMTPEIIKYDPACPICTYGEKRAFKLCEKALKAALELKARKRSSKRIVDSDLNSDTLLDQKGGPKMSSSTNLKSSSGKKAFLRRHFSFNSKASENQSTRKKGFFWAKSSKY